MGWYPCCCDEGDSDCAMCATDTQQEYMEAELPSISGGGFYSCPFNELIADLPQKLGAPALCEWELQTYVTISSIPIAITLWFRLSRNYATANTAAAVFRAVLGHGVHTYYYEWLLEVSDPDGDYVFDCSEVFTLPFRHAVGTSGLGMYCGDTTGLDDVIITPHA